MGYVSIKNKSIAEIEAILKQKLDIHGLQKLENYHNYSTPIKIKCFEHGILYKTPKSILSGYGCFKCAHKATVLKQTLSTVGTSHLQKWGVRFVARDKRKVILQCDKHGLWSSTLKTVKKTNKTPCHKCAQEHKVQNFKIEKVKKISEFCKVNNIDLAYLPIDLRNKFKVGLTCPYHGVVFVDYHSLLNGAACYLCSKIRAADTKRWTLDEVEDLATKRGFKVSFTPEGRLTTKTSVIFVCDKHGEFITTINGFRDGAGCPRCANHLSANEALISSFMSNIIGPDEIITRDRTIIAPKELDIFIPSKNLAVEYCGDYWHTEHKRGKSTHYEKWKLCKEKNIQLITIFESQFLARKDHYLRYLQSKIAHNNTVGARKCEVLLVQPSEIKGFMEENHIQGFANSKICVALKHNNEIVGAMTFGAHHRQNQLEGVVLNRLCFKSGITIQGGASKMLKFAIPKLKEMGYSKIITWSDNAISTGNVYQQIGFTKDDDLGPDYFYSKAHTFKPKQSMTKKALLKMGATGNTELEMARSLGYERVWDCGKTRWILNIGD